MDFNANISLADFSHKKELTELWVEAFGDDEKFILSFLDAYMIPQYNVPIAVADGKIVSAFYLVDFALYSNQKNLGDCAYLFAAATKKEYRNNGSMSELVAQSAELCKNRGLKAIFLFPQNQNRKLFDFYSKFGFKSIYAAKKIYGRSAEARIARPQNSGLRLVNKDITDVNIFDGLYNSYVEFTAKQELAPLKDRLFYFKCASSYLDIAENPENKAYFAVFENNVEKICYVFYKKYKNIYYIDDIILPEYSNISETNQRKFNEAAELLGDFILNSGDDVNFEMNILPSSSLSDSQKNIPMAMILPLCKSVSDIADNLKSPVYINMFMNI